MEVAINYLAILGAVVAAVVLGSLWYGPLFGKAWMREVGLTADDVTKAKTDPSAKNAMLRSYALMTLSSVVMAYVLVHTLAFASAYTQTSGIAAGLMAGFWSWLGFVVPVSLGPVLWENKSWRYWFITSGYYLVNLLIMGVILASFPV
ncbi:MAG: DUF1761 domain-containing protein [Patescibacteria group bacterium]